MIRQLFARWGKSSIQGKILASFCVLLVVSLTAAAVLSLTLVNRYARETAIHHSEQVLSLVSENIDRTIDSIENTSKQVLLNETVVEYCMTAGSMGEYERVTNEISFSQGFFASTLRSNTLISSILLYPSEGYSLSFGQVQQMANDSHQLQPIYQMGIAAGNLRWFPSRQVKGYYGRMVDIISMTRPVFAADSQELVGLLEIQIPTEHMAASLELLGTQDGSGVLLLDEEGQTAVGSSTDFGETADIYEAALQQLHQKQRSTQLEIDGTDYLINCGTLSNGWLLVHYQPMENLTRTADSVGTAILIVGVCMLFLMILISGVLSRQLVRPLHRAIDATSSMEEDIEAEGSSHEIAALFNNYNLMMRRIRESELDTLRAQITPHFLYNTLNSIKCQALLDGSRDVAQMTQWLVNLLELSINNRSEYLTLNGEIDMLRSYVGLQQMRSDKLFTLSVEVTPAELGSCLIPKMILQTLVENAILHGIEGKEEAGTIVVRAAEREGCLIIDVMDDGAGMSEARIRDVLSGKQAQDSKRMNRVGLYNVDQRIKLYFGKAYGISIASVLNKGTTVTIRMPRVEDPEEFQRRRQG